ncbi:MAG: DUF1194 domain-containing protein [Pseudomonadota bacterium]
MRALALVLVLLASPAAAHCRLALVLALDVSSSVNSKEYAIQLGGLADALRRPEVVEAILSPAGTGVAVLAFEWSGADHQRVIAGWSTLDSPGGVAAFADRLSAHRRTADDQSTAIGSALAYAAGRFADAPVCGQRTIDISGDGNNNEGPHPEDLRATGLFEGITINGLVIQGAYPNPVIFYRSYVMQGPEAFVAMARDFDDYPPVIIGKLLRELDVQGPVGAVPRRRGGIELTAASGTPGSTCPAAQSC